MFVYSLIRSGASFPEIIICVLALILAAGLSIIVHEIAHGFVALKCGDPTAKLANRLTLNPAVHFDWLGLLMIALVGFGWARPVPINPNNFKNYKRDLLLVSSAGVASNILMGGLGLLILYFAYPFFLVPISSSATFIMLMLGYYFIMFFISINFMLAFFNLLPIYPLDGFRILNIFLKPYNKYSQFMYQYGSFCLLGLVILGNVFRAVGLEYLDIFYWANTLINMLIGAVVG